jgi:hypothetical protein
MAYRMEILAKARIEFNCTEVVARDRIWPESGKKTREYLRSKIVQESQNLLQCLMQLYPSEEVKLQMSNCQPLRDAEDIGDVIAWTLAFDTFCLSNAGNKDFNIQAAEKALLDTKMKGLDTPDYVKRFKRAVDDAKICGSLMTSERIVALFFRNLNTTSEAFHFYDVKYLNESDPLHAYLTQPLQNAVEHVNRFHQSTVLTLAARRKEGETANNNNNNNKPISSVSDLAKLMSAKSRNSNNNNNNPVLVSHQVLATFLKNKTGDVSKELSNSRKRTATAAATAVTATDTVPIVPSKKPKTEKPACFKFATPEGCKFGSRCRYQHA